jgi:polyhydroxyalkanoate synthase subunit PhaC
VLLPTDLLPESFELRDLLKRFGAFPMFRVGMSPRTKVFELPTLTVFKYSSESKVPKKAESVFLVPSLINKPYVLDIMPGRSLIEFLTSHGRDVYLIEWKAPKGEFRYLDAEDVLVEHPLLAIRAVISKFNINKVHLMGHCLGGVCSIRLAEIFAKQEDSALKSLTLITTPVRLNDEALGTGVLGHWARELAPALNVYQKEAGNMNWLLMQSSFQLAKPTSVLHKLRKLYQIRSNDSALKNFFALEIWSNDNVGVAEKVFNYFINDLYTKDQLVAIDENGSSVLKRIKVPVLSYYSSDDHVVSPDSRLKEADLSLGVELTEIESIGGHVGAVIGQSAIKKHWPKLAIFLDKAGGGNETSFI